ncbi:hypothetical protein [Salinimicrobium terrae]|uniref:hypothetical protein n=1 Tax=Salinimicrobium terrae TaxID=470866 RepID=UPI00041FE23C|nr:hypothetical protein [Salinimicrobium terrae]
MRTIIFFFIVGLGAVGNILGQDLSRYQYVQVPQEFDFLKYQNQYELNALTAFLFEKYGFEALYEEKIPGNVSPCDVLKANVHDKSGLFRSKLYITLEDCKSEIVFTSEIGVSREKDYQRSYHEALREAFTSFEELRKNPDVIIDPVPGGVVSAEKAEPAEVVIDPVPSPEDAQSKNPEVIVDPVITSEEIENAAEEEFSVKSGIDESEDIPKFMNGSMTYSLQRTPSGFDLYREGEEEKFGTLLKSGGGENFLYSSKTISGTAFFDTHGNLMVEYLDPNTQQLVSVKYERKDQ